MPEFQMIDVPETPYLYVTRSCSMDPGDISETMGKAFSDVWRFMQDNAIVPAGAALSVYYTFEPTRMTFRSGFTIAHKDMAKAAGEVEADVTPAGRVMHFTHVGPYATLRDDYGLMMAHVEAQGLKIGAPTWEVYMNDASDTPEDELVTEVYSVLA